MIITITKHYIIQRGSKTGCGLIYQMECEQVASSSFVFFFCIQFCFKVHAMLVDFFLSICCCFYFDWIFSHVFLRIFIFIPFARWRSIPCDWWLVLVCCFCCFTFFYKYLWNNKMHIDLMENDIQNKSPAAWTI